MIGFIGIGNMGGTLARVIRVPETIMERERVLISSRTGESAYRFAEANEGFVVVGNESIAETADKIFLGVKPHQVKEVLEELTPIFEKRKREILLISMAAGVTTAQIEAYCGCDVHVIRIMPNTPCLVNEGCIPYCCGKHTTKADCEALKEMMSTAGMLLEMDESLIDAAGAVAGCGPAFTYIYLEALADAGVACGLPRTTAMLLAAQMACGSARMVLDTQAHPGALKDEVCSPGGSTIAGVCALDEHGFRNAVQKAVLAAYQRNRTLGK